MELEKISRGEAKEKNLTYYFTGKPCPSGHVCERFVSNWGCVICVTLQYTARRLKNPEKYSSSTMKWYNNNKHWHNKSKNRLLNVKISTAKRNSNKLQRIPKWANLEAIKEFYKNCPEGFEVDHIYPLQGELVSGFHILENLQYLTIHDNRVKGNRFKPIYECNNSKI